MGNGEISEEKKNDWEIFSAKDWHEQLTANLYAPGDNARNAFYYLFSNKDLDTKDIAKEIYKEYYKKYKEMAASLMAGDVINSFTNVFIRYFGDSIQKSVKCCYHQETFDKDENKKEFCRKKYEDIEIVVHYKTTEYKNEKNFDGRIKIPKIANMYFHLITTVGNLMPWPKEFNPVIGSKLDIFQYKAPNFFALCKWMGQRDDDFVDNHYLQDFVNDNKTKALKFYDETITDSNIRWNLYFYRASKAIMKRSYRILTKEDPNANEDFIKEFIGFCNKCNIKKEIKDLIGYLEKNNDEMVGDKFLKIEGKEIKNELEEMKVLIDKL